MIAEIVGTVNAVRWNVTLNFEWKIKDISQTISKSTIGDYVKSPTFSSKLDSEDVAWHFRLYPKGVFNQNYLALYLYCDKFIFKAATVTFIIWNKDGQEIINRRMRRNCEFIGPYWGDIKCISRRLIQDPENEWDELTIACKIQYDSNTNILSRLSNERKKNNAHMDVSLPRGNLYEALLASGKFSDVSLVAEGKFAKVHKCILAQSSSVFTAMFESEMLETQKNVVEITDIKFEVLMEMLRFVYTGEVNDIDTLTGELAIAADKYALDGLKILCERAMIKNLCLDNVFESLQTADRLRMEELKKIGIEIIIAKASDTGDKSEFDLSLLPPYVINRVFCYLANNNK